jgi:hypothetical protein
LADPKIAPIEVIVLFVHEVLDGEAGFFRLRIWSDKHDFGYGLHICLDRRGRGGDKWPLEESRPFFAIATLGRCLFGGVKLLERPFST